MKKTLLVIKNEFLSVFLRPSYWLTLILIPLTSFIILLIISGLQKSTGVNAGDAINELFMPSSSNGVEGFVDQSKLMKMIPERSADRLISFSSEDLARQAVESGEVSAYYIIPEDFLESGNIFYIRPDYNPLGGMTQTSALDDLVAYNLLNGDQELTYRIQDPVNLEEIDLSNTLQRDSANLLTFFLPYVVTFMFYIIILSSASLLLNNISGEKQNRVLELLMTSVNAKQLLTGKIIALGITGLLQTVFWSSAGLLLLRFSGRAFNLSSAFQLPVSVLLWGILFFLLGYAVYASLMAGIGALVPNLKEASQLTTIVILPLIIPLMFISTLIQTPNSPLAVVLSFIPFTAPVSMMTRLSATSVPFWQPAVAVLLLIVTAFILVRASASLFRAQNLLSGKSIKTLEFFKYLLGKYS